MDQTLSKRRQSPDWLFLQFVSPVGFEPTFSFPLRYSWFVSKADMGSFAEAVGADPTRHLFKVTYGISNSASLPTLSTLPLNFSNSRLYPLSYSVIRYTIFSTNSEVSEITNFTDKNVQSWSTNSSLTHMIAFFTHFGSIQNRLPTFTA